MLAHATRAAPPPPTPSWWRAAPSAAGVRLGEIEKLTDARKRRLGLRVFAGASVADRGDGGPHAERARALRRRHRRARARDGAGSARRSSRPRRARDRRGPISISTTPRPTRPIRSMRSRRRARPSAPRSRSILGSATPEGAEFSQDASTIAYASTLGFAGSYRRSSFHLGVEPVATHDGQPCSATSGTRARVTSRASRTRWRSDDAPPSATLRRLGARRVKTQEAPVIFESTVAVSLLGHLAGRRHRPEPVPRHVVPARPARRARSPRRAS